jgi:hypothetical protein
MTVQKCVEIGVITTLPKIEDNHLSMQSFIFDLLQSRINGSENQATLREMLSSFTPSLYTSDMAIMGAQLKNTQAQLAIAHDKINDLEVNVIQNVIYHGNNITNNNYYGVPAPSQAVAPTQPTPPMSAQQVPTVVSYSAQDSSTSRSDSNRSPPCGPSSWVPQHRDGPQPSPRGHRIP